MSPCACVYRRGWVSLGQEKGIKCFPKPHRMPPTHWKAFRGREHGSGQQEEPDPENPGAGGARKERKGPQGSMGGRRKQKEMEKRKRKGRMGAPFLCALLLAPQESPWAGKEGSMSCPRGQGMCPEDTTPHQPLSELAAGWAQAALATNLSASLLGFEVQPSRSSWQCLLHCQSSPTRNPPGQDPPSHALPHCCF